MTFPHADISSLLMTHVVELFRRPNPSGYEYLVREYVIKALEDCHFQVEVDPWGNVMATRGIATGGFPLLSFHMDSVEDPWMQESLQVRPRFALFMGSSKQGHTIIHSGQKFILGGDDKCGVALALTLAATTTMPLKIVASVQEEVGCIGIAQVPLPFFADVAYALVLDRRNRSDIITSINGGEICSPSFAQALQTIADGIGQKPVLTEGMLSDALHLSDFIEDVVNLSVGYYRPHTVQEYVVFDHLLLAYAFVDAAVGTLPRSLTSARTFSPCSLCSHLSHGSLTEGLCRQCHAFVTRLDPCTESWR